ncbi:MAG: polysaccharide deacetylase family protein [Deltaproteobacteria bacterium]|nr:polysaccharide deacetylase family protein [Deltaproteobacteria bacterium]
MISLLIYILIPIVIIVGFYILYLIIPQWDGWLGSMKVKYRGKRTAVLTFDDGPDEPWTGRILDILKNEEIKANFFVLGGKALENPDLIKRIFNEGHEIGNHTFAHKKFLFRGSKSISEDLIMTSNIIQKITGELPTLLRTPHGFRKLGLKKILSRLDLQLVPWTKGIWDTDGSNSERLFKRFGRRLANLEILLLHDGTDERLTTKEREATVEVLPKIIDEYRKRGYAFKRISEL